MTLQEIHASRPLGRLFDCHRSNDLRLAKYVDKNVLIDTYAAPAAVNWKAMPTLDGDLPTPDTDPLGNDYLGDCVFAAAAHMINMIFKMFGIQRIITADMVKAEYLNRTGGTDSGYYIRSMLTIWMNEGLWGTKLDGWCTVDKNDSDEVALAIWLGGGIIGGYDLPLASQGQTDAQGRQLWDVPKGGWPAGKGPSTWGGHALYQRGGSPGMDDYNSWGEDTEGTVAWRKDCCSELYLPLVQEWQGPDGRAPNGFAYADLLSDIKARE
jgi:hypothetical protein